MIYKAKHNHRVILADEKQALTSARFLTGSVDALSCEVKSQVVQTTKRDDEFVLEGKQKLQDMVEAYTQMRYRDANPDMTDIGKSTQTHIETFMLRDQELTPLATKASAIFSYDVCSSAGVEGEYGSALEEDTLDGGEVEGRRREARSCLTGKSFVAGALRLVSVRTLLPG